MTSKIGNNMANNQAYNDIKTKTVYASSDGNSNAKIELGEAKTNSVFQTKMPTNENAINQKAQELGGENTAQIKGLIQKYMGNLSFDNIVNTAFKEINYNKAEIKDSENEANVRNQLDQSINSAIEVQVSNINSQIEAKYTEALNNAAKQAQNELNGDSDVAGKGKADSKASFAEQLKGVQFQRTGDGSQGVATFSGAGGAEGASKGYQATVQFLEANGAKSFQREVNGQKQTIYEYKNEQGKKETVVVDDAGQVHKLETTKTFGKNAYITQDAKETAMDIVGKDAKDIEIKRRKVDGQYQNVIRFTDSKGNKQTRVIDHNEVTGQTAVSGNLTHVSAGGRAKYSSYTSGLSTNVRESEDLSFKNGKVKTGTTERNGKEFDTYARTQGSRAKLDQAGVQAAVDNVIFSAEAEGAQCTDNKDTATVTINGHSYTIDKTDFKAADRTIRLIENEINKMRQTPDPPQNESTTIDNTFVEDSRVSANDAEQNEASVQGHKGVKWGVNGDHKSNNTKDVHSLKGHYNASLSRSQFQSEGWATDKARTKETAILKKMDSADIKGDGKSVRNMQNSNEFAARFLKASGVANPSQACIKALGDAIKTANPSLFDGSGNMYKDADFARLNLPTNIDRYTKLV